MAVATEASTSTTPDAAVAAVAATSLLGKPPDAAVPAVVDGTSAADVVAGDKTEAVKPDAVKPAAPVELKVPEGLDAKDPALEAFRGLAKEAGIPVEAAQKLVDLHAQSLKAGAERQAAAREAEQKAWVSELKADKDFGGANLEANTKLVERAAMRFFDAPTRAYLNETGLGNHPGLVRAFHAIGKALSEDSVAGTTAQAGKGDPDAAFLKALYPSMHPKE